MYKIGHLDATVPKSLTEPPLAANFTKGIASSLLKFRRYPTYVRAIARACCYAVMQPHKVNEEEEESQ